MAAPQKPGKTAMFGAGSMPGMSGGMPFKKGGMVKKKK